MLSVSKLVTDAKIRQLYNDDTNSDDANDNDKDCGDDVGDDDADVDYDGENHNSRSKVVRRLAIDMMMSKSATTMVTRKAKTTTTTIEMLAFASVNTTMTTIKMPVICISLLYVYIQRTGAIHSSESRIACWLVA